MRVYKLAHMSANHTVYYRYMCTTQHINPVQPLFLPQLGYMENFSQCAWNLETHNITQHNTPQTHDYATGYCTGRVQHLYWGQDNALAG